MGRGWGRIGQSRSAAGGAAVYNLRLPPKASGKDTGAGPAPGWGLRLTAGRRQKQTREPELVLLLLADVGPIWAQVYPYLGPRLAHVAHSLA